MAEADVFLDVVIAMLAVNRWTIEKTASLADALKDGGFSDPGLVKSIGIDELATRLATAGYKRGPYMEQLLAARIAGAAAVFDDHNVRRLAELVRSHNTSGLRELLLAIKGVGPEVINNFLILQSQPKHR